MFRPKAWMVTSKCKARGLFVMAIFAAGLSSCAGGHAGLGTPTSTCFLALPQAAQAVHSSGKLIGVKSFNPNKLSQELQRRLARIENFQIGSLPGQSTGGTQPGDLKRRRAIAYLERVNYELERFNGKDVCAVEYQGKYLPGSVSYSLNMNSSGPYALIVLPERGGQPVISLVLKRLPISLRHFF